MFVAGVALAFSIGKQKLSLTWNQRFVRILKRCGWLFFWGVLDYAVRKKWSFIRALGCSDAAFFYHPGGFLIMGWPVAAQLAVSGLCLLIPELLYRFSHIPGFDQPFTDQHNFGNYIDLILMNKSIRVAGLRSIAFPLPAIPSGECLPVNYLWATGLPARK
ncbi:MAG: hypothetical protein WDM78_04735 [Puia sp.]